MHEELRSCLCSCEHCAGSFIMLSAAGVSELLVGFFFSFGGSSFVVDWEA